MTVNKTARRHIPKRTSAAPHMRHLHVRYWRHSQSVTL